MSRKHRIIISITGICIIALILLSLTYGYYLTNIKGNTNTKSITASTADLKLVYGDGSGTLAPTGVIQPGTTIGTKTFTVTNDGNRTVSDYVVVLENVYNEFSRPEDIVYTLTCTSTSGNCNGVSEETQFPSGGGTIDDGDGFGIVVINTIEPDVTHNYTITLKYLEPNVDQSEDMGKTVTGKINIKDAQDINPYKNQDGTLAKAIIDNAINVTNEEKNNGHAVFRTTPLTKPAEETTMYYNEGTPGSETTANYQTVRNPTTSYYFTYGDTFTLSGSSHTIKNNDGSALKAVKYSTGYATLKGKYIVSYSGSSSSTPVSGANKKTIYYVVNATSTQLTYTTVSSGLKQNERYITYGDSYKFNKKTGNYDIINKSGSALKTVKYKDNISKLVGKYIVSTSGSTSSTPVSGTNRSTIYQVTSNSTESQIKYKSITKSSSSYNSAENTLSITNDDYGVSYYYRGGVEDNYVNFAGMCWRIVRIEGDGSTKIILEDQDSTCATSNGNWVIPTTTGGTTKKGNFGFTQYAANTLTASDGTKNSSTRYLMNYLNGGTNNDKSMSTAFKNFQTGPLSSYLSYLKAGDWCLNDKAYATGRDNTTPLSNQEMLDKQIKGTTFYYDSYVRLDGKTPKEPTLKCNGTNMSKFADNIDMYVGTLTADEIVYAGGKVSTSNSNFYLINDYQKSNSLSFWSLSPYYFFSSHDYAFYVDFNGNLNDINVGYGYNSFRPAVFLKSNVQITGGDGTKANAYTIG